MVLSCLFCNEKGGYTMLRKGNSLDELINTLADVQTKNVFLPNAKSSVDIRIEYRGDTLLGWKLNTKNGSGGTVIDAKQGKRYSGLITTIQKLDQVETLFKANEDDAILCLRNIEKITDQYTVSYWFAIDPGVPFTLDADGQPKFRIMQFKLKKWEHERMMETKIAFLHDGILYPIMQSAVHNIGSLLGCSSILSVSDDYQLGPALILAERFSRTVGLNFCYRKSSEVVRPVVAIYGKTFKMMNLLEFFQQINAYMPGVYTLCKWEATDLLVTAWYQSMEDSSIQIKVKAGDLPGQCIAVSAVQHIGIAEIPILTNRMSHKIDLSEELYSSLFSGIGDAISCWKCMELSAGYQPKMLNGIFRILGKKRAAAVKTSKIGSFEGWDLVKEIINRTYCSQLGTRQQEALMEEYAKIIRSMTKEEP